MNGSFHETAYHTLFVLEMTVGAEGNPGKKRLSTGALPQGFTAKAATESRGQRLKELRSIKNILKGTTVLIDTANYGLESPPAQRIL